ADTRGTAANRRDRRLYPAVARHRARGRHRRRPQAGARRGVMTLSAESELSFVWPIDLRLTVASHGWVYLEPWRWEDDAGRLLRRETIGGHIGTIAVRQSSPRTLALSSDGFADDAGPEIR